MALMGVFLYLLYLKEKMNFYWNCPLEVSFCGYSLGKGFPFLPRVCRFCSVVHRDVRVAFSDWFLTINSFFFHFKWLYFADVPSDQDQFYLFSCKPWWKRYLQQNSEHYFTILQSLVIERMLKFLLKHIECITDFAEYSNLLCPFVSSPCIIIHP